MITFNLMNILIIIYIY